MKRAMLFRSAVVACLFSFVPAMRAQEARSEVADPEAPRVSAPGQGPVSLSRLMKFTGVLKKADGSVRSGVQGLTFALYRDQNDGSPLWIETLNAEADAEGRYTALLGSTKSDGLPIELFTSGEARWLGIRGQMPWDAEQRALLVSVPYALKAVDAETLSGKPASAFVLAESRSVPAGTVGALQATDVTCIAPCISSAEIEDGAIVNADISAAAGIGPSKIAGTAATLGTNTFTGLQTAAAFQGTSAGFTPIFGNSTATSGVVYGVYGQSASSSGRGLYGLATATSGTNYGVFGQSASTSGRGINGLATAASGTTYGVFGQSASTSGRGIYGTATASSGTNYGVYGQSSSTTGRGVYGVALATSGTTYGAFGQSNSTSGRGVYGLAGATSGTNSGVYGQSASTSGRGVYGIATNISTSASNFGVYGESAGSFGVGVKGVATATTGPAVGVSGVAVDSPDGIGLYGNGGSAGYGVWSIGNARVNGDLTVTGSVSKGSGSFQIDHPLDPANKYLYHSFVESPDMMNIYNGNAVLDEDGEAWVELPSWFEALNRNFRYQLTAIGGPGPNLYVAREMESNRFRIAGGKAGLKVSWQVTGVRQDAYAEARRIKVEEDKPEKDRGLYLYPELYGQPKEKGIDYAHRPPEPPPANRLPKFFGSGLQPSASSSIEGIAQSLREYKQGKSFDPFETAEDMLASLHKKTGKLK